MLAVQLTSQLEAIFNLQLPGEGLHSSKQAYCIGPSISRETAKLLVLIRQSVVLSISLEYAGMTMLHAADMFMCLWYLARYLATLQQLGRVAELTQDSL